MKETNTYFLRIAANKAHVVSAGFNKIYIQPLNGYDEANYKISFFLTSAS